MFGLERMAEEYVSTTAIFGIVLILETGYIIIRSNQFVVPMETNTGLALDMESHHILLNIKHQKYLSIKWKPQMNIIDIKKTLRKNLLWMKKYHFH